MIIGAIATPFTYTLLRRLPDRGYAFVKVVGMLVVCYAFWILGSLGFLNNGLGGILVALGVMIGLSAWTLYRRRSEIQEESVVSWIRGNWRYVLAAELVFAIIFALWTWVRAQNPAISGTEKPMEFAFLNAVGRSPNFPSLDPWMSGFAISYYYFGYVMTSVITRLAAVPEAVGFNLAIAWLIAASALGAFGLVYNLISASRGAIRRSALMFALIAAVALPIAGNLEIAAEVLYAEGIGPPEFWEWLDIRDINEPLSETSTPRYESSQWWWWRSSRVIHEYSLSGREEAGLEPIAEFPSFSFVLGDLHPHVLMLPFAFLSLVVALRWWLHPGPDKVSLKEFLRQRKRGTALEDMRSNNGARRRFTILLLGGVSFLNTWDVLVYMFVIVAAFMLGKWRQKGHWQRGILFQGLTLAILLIIGSLIFYLPFYLGLRSQAGPPFILPMIMRPTRLVHLLVIFGMSMIGVVALLLTLLIHGLRTRSKSRQRRYLLRSLLITAGILVGLLLLMTLLGLVIASSDEGLSTVFSLADDLNLSLPDLSTDPSFFLRFRWAVAAVTILLPDLFVARLPHSALVLFLLTLIFVTIYLVMRLLDRDLEPLALETKGEELESDAAVELESHEDQQPQHEPIYEPPRVSLPAVLPFVLLLVLTGTLLVLGPEFIYLKDNFGQRLNTIFKFYYQAWVLFGVAALFGLDYLLRNFKIVGIIAAAGYGAALVVSLLFPYYAIQSRAVEYRGALASEDRAPATLDGLSHIGRYNPDELEAIAWLRTNVSGTPVILEAVGGQYTGFGRISANTGLPTVLGWAGHEYQWRGSTPEPAQRGSAVAAIYDGLDWEQIEALLEEYDVTYIYLGALERNTYGSRAEELFDLNLNLAYQNDSVKIYQWTPPT